MSLVINHICYDPVQRCLVSAEFDIFSALSPDEVTDYFIFDPDDVSWQSVKAKLDAYCLRCFSERIGVSNA